jgi:uncharacterized protein
VADLVVTPTIGIGLRQPHYAALLNTVPPLAFVEVHSENFFADGGAALSVLDQTRERYPLSLHGVGLGLGSAVGVDSWHLDRLARLMRRVDPLHVSDHACFARGVLSADGPVIHANDLLPGALTKAALNIMVSNVMQVQERLGRSILVENLSSYLAFADDAFSEPEFFKQLCQRSGCGMLLDVNNLMVNALNAASDGRSTDPLSNCCQFIDALPLNIVGEIHVAGYCETEFKDLNSDESMSMVIDDHGSRVRPGVWAVYEHALRRFGPVLTLVEWDTDIPALEVLLAEAQHAARLSSVICGSVS